MHYQDVPVARAARRIGRALALVLALAAAACAVRGPRVTHLAKGDPEGTGDGLYYALPRTVVVVKVPLARKRQALTPLGVRVVGVERALVGQIALDFDAARRALEAARTELAKSANPAAYHVNAKTVREAGDALAVARNAFLRVSWSQRVLGTFLPDLYPYSEGEIKTLVANPDSPAKPVKTYELKDAEVTSRAEADPEQAYFVALEGGSLEDRSVKLALTELGLMTSANATAQDNTVEFAVSVLETVGKVGAAAAKGASFVGRDAVSDAHAEAVLEETSAAILDGLDARFVRGFAPGLEKGAPNETMVDESDAAFVRDLVERRGTLDWIDARQRIDSPKADGPRKTFEARLMGVVKELRSYRAGAAEDPEGGSALHSLQRLSPFPPEALDLATMLRRLRDDRRKFTVEGGTAEGGATVETFRAALALMDKEEETHLAAFRRPGTDLWNFVTEFRPSRPECAIPGAVEVDLAVFSESSGIRSLRTGDFVDERFAYSLEAGKPAAADEVTLRLRILLDPEEPLARTVEASRRAGSGEARSIYYRIPVAGLTTLRSRPHPFSGDPDEPVGTGVRMAIAQLGTVASLPVRLAGSGLEYGVDLYEASGAIKQVLAKTTSGKPGEVVSAAGTAATEIGEASRDSKRDRLQRKLDLLKLEKEIREIEEDLAKPPPTTPETSGD